jgi:hypothetical protein
MDNDRTVHAIAQDGSDIVRYNKAGKWWIEHPTLPRRQITVHQAAELAAQGTPRPGLPGGTRFDALTRSIAATLAH